MLGVAEKECIQACQSFLWGGTGVPSYDDAGTCSCSCERGWKTFNLVAHASCVPRSAYKTFGYVGLVLSLAHLIHAAYNLKQQRHSEALKGTGRVAVKMLVDVYREQLSMITIANAPVIGLYFALALWLPAEHVRWSALALGVSQSLSGIGAVLTMQVLIRSFDPRLLKNGAFVLKVSAALTHPVGRVISYSVVSIGGGFLVCLASIDWTGQGYKIASIVYIIVTVTRVVIIILCGRSMVKMIDKSMKRLAAKQRADGAAEAGGDASAVKITADPKLAAAKKTILSALFFCIKLTGAASAVLIFALVTEYGTDNPIVFLATPLAFGPMVALSFHIQLHSKRNKVSPLSPKSTMTQPQHPNSAVCSFGGTTNTATGSVCGRGATTGSSRVFPIEEPGGKDQEMGMRINNIEEHSEPSLEGC